MITADFIDSLQELLKEVDYELIRDTYGTPFAEIAAKIVGVAFDAYKHGKAVNEPFECEIADRVITLRTVLCCNTIYPTLPF